MINFVIIGGGWRAEFYLRIAKSLPEHFRISAICVRNKERGKEIAQRFSVKVVETIPEVLSEPFDFIVNCINKDDISELSIQLADSGYYVLSETPIMKKPTFGHSYEKIQVAEQFHLKGTYQALKRMLDAGIIGEINHIDMSVAHDYHAMSLMRFLLDDESKPEILCDLTLADKMIQTNGRTGVLHHKRMVDSVQAVKVFRFHKATVIYDYNKEQYFSSIRKDRLMIRGTKGEIDGSVVRYLNEKNEPVVSSISHVTSGLLDGLFCDKITFENQVLFAYPFPDARLSEEELAIAQCLINMKEYIETGKGFYTYERAYQDWMYFTAPSKF